MSEPSVAIAPYEARMEAPVEAPMAGRPSDRLTVRHKGRLVTVKPSEIDWCESAGNYIRLHINGNAHLIRETLQGLEGRLDPTQFVRIHRRVIVNVSRIRELKPWFGGDQIVLLRDGGQLRLSRTFRHKVAGRLPLTH
jgi:two-component system LytT family response regulator